MSLVIVAWGIEGPGVRLDAAAGSGRRKGGTS
jgi:hypothetical protein